VNWSAELVGEVPAGVVTVMSTGPVRAAGENAAAIPDQVAEAARPWVYWWAAASEATSWANPTEWLAVPVDTALKPPPGEPEIAALAPTAPTNRSPGPDGVIDAAEAMVEPEPM
jgi:hypothetical protein